MNCNKLNAAQNERLVILSEECSEVIQIVCKIQRHGYDNYHPKSKEVNRVSLEKECGDIQNIIKMLCDSKDLDKEAIGFYAKIKNISIKEYLHHQ